MNFLSKDAPLKASIFAMKSVLEEVGCQVTHSREKHPLTSCYSVNLSSVEAPNHIYSNGKGIVSDASMASALGEYIERLQTNNFFIDFYLPNRSYYPDQVAFDFGGNYLNSELLKLFSAAGELAVEDLIDFNSSDQEKIVTLPFIGQSDETTVYFPLNILSNLYLSNGLATGNTRQEALVQSLSEIFERNAKIEIIKQGYALPKFPEEVVQSFPRLHADLQELRSLGFIVDVLDASLGGKYPVTAISIINTADASLFVSFGAHPILEVALERTMTELMQGRDLDNLDSFTSPTFDLKSVADSSNLESHFVDSNGKLAFQFLNSRKSFDYTPWDYVGEGSDDEYQFLSNILATMGKEIYLREYNYLGFYSCQVIVPGFSEVYPIEDLIYNNRNCGKWIRAGVLDLENADHELLLEAVESLNDTLNIDHYIGVIFENKFTMGELKAQLHLLLGDLDEALMALTFGSNKLGHVVAELIRMHSADLNWQDYEEALTNIFGEEKLQKAIKVLNGEELLIDTTLHPHYTQMLEMYDRLEVKKQSIIAQ